MRCKDCGFANGEDDHRCLRCGRRLPGIVIAAPVGYSGANALAMAPDYRPSPVELEEPGPMPPLPLFGGDSGRNVIPFDRFRQRFTDRSGVPAVAATPPSPVSAPP